MNARLFGCIVDQVSLVVKPDKVSQILVLSSLTVLGRHRDS